VDNRQKSKTPLSGLEAWRNLCDALSEDALLEGPEPTLSVDVAVNIKLRLSKLAEEGQSPADQAERIRLEQDELEHRDYQDGPTNSDETTTEKELRGDEPTVPTRRQS
jgi:hypothetical protein